MFASIQSYLRSAASRNRITTRIGPFLATVTADTSNLYLNYAIPDDGAEPTADDVAALIAFYQQKERAPRLEYMTGLAPAVQPALMAHGFTIERSTPLMIHDAASAPPVPLLPGIELFAPQSDQEILGMASALSEAYGGDGLPAANAAQSQRKFAAAGGISVASRDTASGLMVGGGVCDVPFHATTELAGIGVRNAYRRRGIAAAMTAWLVGQALAAGTTNIFLMAAGEAEARIYGRVGFTPIGEVLHISHP